MPQYKVKVAHRKTGEEQNITVYADSPADAQAKTEVYGLISGQPQLVEEYSTPMVAPTYKGMVWSGNFFYLMGFMGVGVSLIMLCIAIASGGNERGPSVEFYLTYFISLLVFGVSSLATACLLNTIADIAVFSWHTQVYLCCLLDKQTKLDNRSIANEPVLISSPEPATPARQSQSYIKPVAKNRLVGFLVCLVILGFIIIISSIFAL